MTSKTIDGNLSIYCGDLAEALRNKQQFFNKLGIDPQTVVELKQIHSSKVIKIDHPTNQIKTADGLITNNKEIYLMIKAADCHQIALYDPKHQAIGLIHAGKKGLELKIIKKAIELMGKHYQTKPENILIQFGPSIGPCHYKTDIWMEAEIQLTESGVKKENIDNPRICTYETADYFSHRRADDQKTKDFRFATIVGLNNAS